MVGAAPSFSDIHLLRTLMVLKKKKTGRKKLVKILDVGEGSIRTIIKKLIAQGLIISSRQGHSLTQKGKEYVNVYLDKFKTPEEFYSSDLPADNQSMVVIHKALDKVKKGVDLRDVAIKAGADGAVILTFSKNKLNFPLKDMKVSGFPDMSDKLRKRSFSEKDVIVIVFGKSKASAENGTLAIALELVQ